jgi:hypothetical protein
MVKSMIVISGPEKVGKTTLCKKLVTMAGWAGLDADYVHFSGATPVTQASIDAAITSSKDMLIWDRSWACGVVYQALGIPQKPEAILAEGEKLFGRLCRSIGTTIILVEDYRKLEQRRTPDDLPIPPLDEVVAYTNYGYANSWSVKEAPLRSDLDEFAWLILTNALANALKYSHKLIDDEAQAIREYRPY